MSFDASLYKYLSKNITTADSISAGKAPQGEKDKFLVFTKIAGTRDYAHDGPLKTIQIQYQFDSYAKKNSDALLIKQELQRILEDFRGDMEGTHVQGAFITGEFDEFGDEYYRQEVEYKIQYYEGVI